jgi:hypothetical protein
MQSTTFLEKVMFEAGWHTQQIANSPADRYFCELKNEVKWILDVRIGESGV